MVDLEPLDDLDVSWLVGTVYRHHEETGSDVAEPLLADWPFSVGHFVKVMPRDYKRVLHRHQRGRGDRAATSTRRSWPPSKG